MTLEEAIRHAEEKAKRGGECGEDHAQLAMWLRELQKLRAVETEKRNGKSTQNVPKEDLISRKAAIDAVNGVIADYIPTLYGRYEALPLEMAMAIKRLPTAQPEIIRCKECKYWKDSDGVYRRGFDAESKCPLNLKKVYEGTFYCGMAERRTDAETEV